MLRRTLVITAVAVALSAAAAFAFAPSVVGGSHGWSLGGLWSGRGFTPDPQAHNPLTASGDVLLQNGDGTPGTYCPIPPRNQSAPGAQAVTTDPAFDAGASSASQSKPDLLQPPPAANCAPPPTAASQSSSAPRPALP